MWNNQVMLYAKNAVLNVLDKVKIKLETIWPYIPMVILTAILVVMSLAVIYMTGYVAGATAQENWTNKNIEYICQRTVTQTTLP